MSLISLLPPQLPQPPATRLGIHSVNWWGDPKHPDVGFKSDDPATVARHMDMMMQSGITYNVMNWRGATVNPTQHRAVSAWIAEAENRGKVNVGGECPFKIAVQLDVGMFLAGMNATAELLNQLTAVKSWVDSPAYLDNLVCEFGTEAVQIDWALIKSSFPNLRFLFRKKGYLWIEMPQPVTLTTSARSSLDILKAQYAQTPIPVMGVVYRQFDDAWPQDRTKTVWPPKAGTLRGPARWIPDDYGRLWFDTFAAAPAGIPYLSIATWDDFEENTDIARVIALAQGRKL
jgi:hypothetical protein